MRNTSTAARLIEGNSIKTSDKVFSLEPFGAPYADDCSMCGKDAKFLIYYVYLPGDALASEGRFYAGAVVCSQNCYLAWFLL